MFTNSGSLYLFYIFFMFSTFRTLGYITSEIPIQVQSRGQQYFIYSAIHDSVYVYDGQKLQLSMVIRTGHPVVAFTAFKDIIIASTNSKVLIFRRNELVRTLDIADVVQLQTLGEILYCITPSKIYFFNSTFELVNELEMEKGFGGISSVVHPSTYVNKLLIGSNTGILRLYNINSLKMIYEFKSLQSGIGSLVQAPAIDVIAIGLFDGSILLHNIKTDTRLFSFSQNGSVSDISFRTDEIPHMATSSNETGEVAIWNLESRNLQVLFEGHKTRTMSLFYYGGMNVLVSAGDNAIKQWIFDDDIGRPRLLKSRSGHADPPTSVDVMEGLGGMITGRGVITSSATELRYISMTNDAQSFEFSTGTVPTTTKKGVMRELEDAKMNPITGVSFTNPKHPWSNLVTIHEDSPTALAWSTQNKKLDTVKVNGLNAAKSFTTSDGSVIKSVFVTLDQDFVVLGTENGKVEKYSLQSGRSRGPFVDEPIQKAHSKCITGICSTDETCTVMLTCSLDKTIKYWSFKTLKPLHTITVESPITLLKVHKEAGIFGVACDDSKIRLFETATHTKVREFKVPARITDFVFSLDGRTLICSSTDRKTRVWDIPANQMMDIFQTEKIVTALSMTTEFLLCNQVGHKGVFMLSNTSLYTPLGKRRVTEADVRLLELNGTSKEQDTEFTDDEMTQVLPDNDERDWVRLDTPFSLLSLCPPATSNKWTTLLNIETIKERNKPIEPPKVEERAPFFISNLVGSKEAEAETIPQAPAKPTTESSRIITLTADEEDHDFVKWLSQNTFFENVKELSPSQLDFQVRTLPVSKLPILFEALEEGVQSKSMFEMIQSLISVVLKVHASDILSMDLELLPQLESLQNSLTKSLENTQNQVWIEPFQVFEIPPNGPEKTKLYYQKIYEIDTKIEQLLAARNQIIDKDVYDLKPSERLFLQEYDSRLMNLQQDKRYWLELIANLDSVQSVVAGTAVSGFERDVMRIPMYAESHITSPFGEKVLPDDSVSQARIVGEESTIKSENSDKRPNKRIWTLPGSKKIWIVGSVAFLVLLIVGLTVGLVILLNPSTPVQNDPKATIAPSPSSPTVTPSRGFPKSYTVSTVAGTGTSGFQDGLANTAQFNGPVAITVDPTSDDLIIIDSRGNRLRRLSKGVVTTIAGDGNGAFADGSAQSARFDRPAGVTFGVDRNLYVSDTFNHRIRVIAPRGVVSTLSGNGTEGTLNGRVSNTLWSLPVGITTDKSGNLFVADYGSNSIRRIDTNGVVSTFAGMPGSSLPSRDGAGTEAVFNRLSDLFFDPNGNLLVAEREADRIRRVNPQGVVSTIPDTFVHPWGLAMDQSGILYISESRGHRISGLYPNGTRFLVAMTGIEGSRDGNGNEATFSGPHGMVFDSKGVLYVVDHFNHKIRAITPVWN